MKLEKGDRVQVLAHWNWPGCRRVVRGRKGPIEFYWVSSDKSQRDGDGDGRYFGGEVETEYLMPLEAG